MFPPVCQCRHRISPGDPPGDRGFPPFRRLFSAGVVSWQRAWHTFPWCNFSLFLGQDEIYVIVVCGPDGCFNRAKSIARIKLTAG